MTEAQEFVTPTRTQRMAGVDIRIDGETWNYTLENAGIPIDTPLDQLKVRRYATKGGRIILKVQRVRA